MIPLAVQGFAGRHGNPSFADAILFHVRILFNVKLDANVMLHNVCMVEAAARVNGETVGEWRKLCGDVHGVKQPSVKIREYVVSGVYQCLVSGLAFCLALVKRQDLTPDLLLAEKVDAKAFMAVYTRFYPQQQHAYRELGYPKGYFNDRLV